MSDTRRIVRHRTPVAVQPPPESCAGSPQRPSAWACPDHGARYHISAAGGVDPSPLLYEFDYNDNAINVFPTSASGNVAPAFTVTSNSDNSLSGPQGAVFDANGNLWVANNTGNTIVEFALSQLTTSGSPTPKVVITDTLSPTGLAFDTDGNLWVTNEYGGVEEFTADQLTSSGSPSPTITLSVAQDGSWGLTFDAAGDLWVGDHVADSLVEYTPDLAGVVGKPDTGSHPL